MNCKYFDRYMSLYIDHILDDRDKERFEKHLKQCPKCMKNLEEMRNIVAKVGGLKQEPLPLDFHKELFAKIQEKKTSKIDYKIKWVGAMAGVIVILFSLKAILDTDMMKGLQKNASPPDQIGEDAMESPNGGSRPQDAKDIEGEMEKDNKDNNAHGDPVDRDESKGDKEDTPKIQRDIVEVYARDGGITLETLMNIVIDNKFTLIESTEDSVVIQFTDDEQKKTLYDELSKLGKIKEIGKIMDNNRTKIIIKARE